MLLCQHKYLLSERQSTQLLYSCFVNTQGIKGRNIPADLHIEHPNKICKGHVRDLGPNETTEAIVHFAKSIGTVDSVINSFDSLNEIEPDSGNHRKVDRTGDIKTIVEDRKKRKAHPSFKKPVHLLHHKDWQKLQQYVEENIPNC